MSEGPERTWERGLVDRKLVEAPSNFIASRPETALLFRFFMVVLLSICLCYASIVAICIAAHFAVCHVFVNKNINKQVKMAVKCFE